jgi:predicted dehydrogenase
VTGLALVGCGAIGRKRLAQLPAGVRCVACYDLNRGQADAVAEGTSIVACSTLAEALRFEGVDLVLVATTHDALAEVALEAVANGRHVLVEKPGADRLASLLELRDQANSNGVVVRVGYNHRFHPALRHLRDLVRSDRFGSLLFARARYGHGGRVGYESEWRADPLRSGGGELIDQGSHLVDLVRSLFGDVELAFAERRTAFWNMPVEDNAFLAVRPLSGGFAWLHASWTEWKNLFSFEVMLERAKLEVTGLGGSYGPERLTVFEMQPEMGPPPETSWEYPRPDHSWRDEMSDVIDAIEGRPAIGASIDDAVATLAIVDEAYRR